MRRSPRFTITALTLLVLGIGSATAIFSIAYAVLVRPLPYADADRLVFLAEHEGSGIAWPNFDDWRRRATSFDGLASSLADAVIVTDGQLPQRFDSRSVTANFFGVLGVSPFRGRLFDQSDARPGRRLDRRRQPRLLDAGARRRPAAIGQTVSLNRRPYTVIGVLPPGFRYMTPADVYLLLEPQVAANYRGDAEPQQPHESLCRRPSEARRRRDLGACGDAEHRGRAGTGVSGDQQGQRRTVLPLADRVVGDMAPTLRVLAGAVALLLLIACVNLASLLLNRSAARAHEFSIRAAIGGGRWSLIRQLLIEHALLVVAGGVLGALAGAAILTGLVSVAPRRYATPRRDPPGPRRAVLHDALQLCLCVPRRRAARTEGVGRRRPSRRCCGRAAARPGSARCCAAAC